MHHISDVVLGIAATVLACITHRDSSSAERHGPTVVVSPLPGRGKGFTATPFEGGPESIVGPKCAMGDCRGCDECRSWAIERLRTVSRADVDEIGRLVAVLAIRVAHPDICCAPLTRKEALLDVPESALASFASSYAHVALLRRAAEETSSESLRSIWLWNAAIIERAVECLQRNYATASA